MLLGLDCLLLRSCLQFGGLKLNKPQTLNPKFYNPTSYIPTQTLNSKPELLNSEPTFLSLQPES